MNSKPDRILMIMAVTLLVTAFAQAQSTRVQSDNEGNVVIETNDAAALSRSVIESTLVGIGRMLGEMRGTRSSETGQSAQGDTNSDVRVEFDDDGNVQLKTDAGGRIEIDGETGSFEIHGADAHAIAGSLIENGLRSVGTMLRLMSGRSEHVGSLSAAERQRLSETWEALGWSTGRIHENLLNLEAAGASVASAKQAAEAAKSAADAAKAAADSTLRRLGLRGAESADSKSATQGRTPSTDASQRDHPGSVSVPRFNATLQALMRLYN